VEIVEPTWRKSGDIKIDQAARTAVLMINERPVCENLEQTVIHELLHLKLYGLDQMPETLLIAVFGADEKDSRRIFAYDQFFGLLEPTVEDLAKGYLSASGSREPVSFGRVQRQVAAEKPANL